MNSCVPMPLASSLRAAEDSLNNSNTSSHEATPPSTSASSQLQQQQTPESQQQQHISYEGRLHVLPAPSGFYPQTSSKNFMGRNLNLSVSMQDDSDSTGDDDPKNSSSTSDLERLQEMMNKTNHPPSSPCTEDDEIEGGIERRDSQGISTFSCHLCPFSCQNREDFNGHVNGHYEFKCPKCEFEAKDEDAYRGHLKDEHNLSPEELDEEQESVRTPGSGRSSSSKPKSFKCKQCHYRATTKEDFWKHTKEHIKPEKLLTCPKCPFVTEYKHHLEYHLRNHFGSKPFKCSTCSYTCVNKSMLNSHMKSHTNVYQYRCADCTYATKYCHSLKLHLRKYTHKPAMVLNSDGTPNPLPVVDVYGTRRGPKIKKDENGLPILPPYVVMQMQQQQKQKEKQKEKQKQQQKQPSSDASNSASAAPVAAVSPFRNEDDDEEDGNNDDNEDIDESINDENLKCSDCEFETASKEVFDNHTALHAKMRADEEESSTQKEIKDEKPEELDIEEMKNNDEPNPSLPYIEYLKKVAPLLRQSASSSSTSSSTSTSLPLPVPIHPLQQQQQPQPPQQTSFLNPGLIDDSNISPFRSYFENMVKSLHQSSRKRDEDLALDLSGQQEEDETSTTIQTMTASSSTTTTMTTTANGKNRRKGKAYKIERKMEEGEEEGDEESPSSKVVNPPQSSNVYDWHQSHICNFCELAFKDPIMYTIHMGYHGFQNPFKCNMCGEELGDKLAFFLHIARKSHI